MASQSNDHSAAGGSVQSILATFTMILAVAALALFTISVIAILTRIVALWLRARFQLSDPATRAIWLFPGGWMVFGHIVWTAVLHGDNHVPIFWALTQSFVYISGIYLGLLATGCLLWPIYLLYMRVERHFLGQTQRRSHNKADVEALPLTSQEADEAPVADDDAKKGHDREESF